MGSGKSIGTDMKLLSKQVRDELKSIKREALAFLPMTMLVLAYLAFALWMVASVVIQLSGALGGC